MFCQASKVQSNFWYSLEENQFLLFSQLELKKGVPYKKICKPIKTCVNFVTLLKEIKSIFP